MANDRRCREKNRFRFHRFPAELGRKTRKERRVVGALELVNKEEGIVVADRQKRNEIRLYFSLLLDIPSSTRERRNIVYEGRRIKLPLSVDEALEGLLVRCASIIRSASELDVRSWKGRGWR